MQVFLQDQIMCKELLLRHSALGLELPPNRPVFPMPDNFVFDVFLKELYFLDLLVQLNFPGQFVDCGELILPILVNRNAAKGNCQELILVHILVFHYVVRVGELAPVHVTKLLLQFLILLDDFQIVEQLLFRLVDISRGRRRLDFLQGRLFEELGPLFFLFVVGVEF